MKRMKHLAAGVAFGLFMAGTAITIEARQMKADYSFSGYFINTDFDVNQDGGKAVLGTIDLKGFLGSDGSSQGVAEYVFAGEAMCPNGNAGFESTLITQDLDGKPVVWRGINRVDRTGDLLFVRYTAGTVCFDPITTFQFFTVEFEVLAGSGKLDGASGTGVCEGTAVQLVGTAADKFFGGQEGTCSATLDLPTGADTRCSLNLLGLPCPDNN